MSKYSTEFKQQIVKEYLDGSLGYGALAQKYKIGHKKSIQEWVRQYKRDGKKGLERKKMKVYSSEFKLNVLNYMKTTGASYSTTATHFGIPDIGTIANWKTKFIKGGVEALAQSKGRPRKDMKKTSQLKETKLLTREQQLEEEVKLLRIEIEYLKKCRAYGLEPWSQRIKSKPKSSKN